MRAHSTRYIYLKSSQDSGRKIKYARLPRKEKKEKRKGKIRKGIGKDQKRRTSKAKQG